MQNHPLKKYLLATSLLAAVGFAGSSHAVDGVFEISESCAISFGCFDGDSAGFPVTITEPGSYRLTSNLTTDSVDTTLIDITADNVSIDLNGFGLIGPVSCTGDEPTCSGGGIGRGINAVDALSATNNLQVRNGFISGMGASGILAGANVTVMEVTSTSNGGNGISIISGLVKDCLVRDNRSFGIASRGLAIDNWADNNGLSGLFGRFGGGTYIAYGNNLLTSNNTNSGSPQVTGNSAQISTNICGSEPCP